MKLFWGFYYNLQGGVAITPDFWGFAVSNLGPKNLVLEK